MTMNYYEEIGAGISMFIKIDKCQRFLLLRLWARRPFFNKINAHAFLSVEKSEKIFPEVQQELQDQQIA